MLLVCHNRPNKVSFFSPPRLSKYSTADHKIEMTSLILQRYAIELPVDEITSGESISARKQQVIFFILIQRIFFYYIKISTEGGLTNNINITYNATKSLNHERMFGRTRKTKSVNMFTK